MSTWSSLMRPLTRWFRREPRSTQTHFLLYTRAGCHLCHDAELLLHEFRHEYAFSLETLDVDAEPQLVAKHGNCVPVVVVNGKVRFRGRVNRVLLTRLLQAEANRNQTSR